MAEAKNADLKQVMDRLDALERENAALRASAKPGEAPRPAPRAAPSNKTGANSHRATQRGYANGLLIEAGEFVPPDVPVSDEWMEPLGKKGRDMARAMDEALSPDDADVNVEDLSGEALTGYAASLSINRGDLNDKQLRAAVAAKRADTA